MHCFSFLFLNWKMNYFQSVCPSVNILISLHYYHTTSLAIVNHYQSYFRWHQKCIDRWKTVMSSIFSIAKKYRGWKYHWNFENQHWVQNQGVNTLWPKKLSGALNRRSLMRVLAVIFSKPLHFFVICPYIFMLADWTRSMSVRLSNRKEIW